MPTSKTDYSDLVKKSKQFLEWLYVRNIKTQETRLEKLFHNLNLINKAFKEGIAVIKHLSEEEYIFTLLESKSLFSVYDQFHTYPNNFVSNKKLKEIISGPYLPGDEESGNANVNPRNTLFELEFAAFVHSYGFRIIGFDDLVFEYKDKQLFVECKRIISNNRLEANITKAVTQLENKINCQNSFGLIAISLDKYFNLDKKMLLINDLNIVQKEAWKLCDVFVKGNKVLLNSIHNSKIIGCILVFKFYAQLQNNVVTPNHCYLPFIYPTVANTTDEFVILKNLYNKLKL